MRLSQITASLLIASTCSGTALAAPKVSLQDIHFSSQQEAKEACGRAPVKENDNGTFSCDMAINEKGTDNNKKTPK